MGAPEIVSEVAAASTDVRHYIAAEPAALLENRDFTEALAGFLLPDAASHGGARSSGGVFVRCPFPEYIHRARSPATPAGSR